MKIKDMLYTKEMSDYDNRNISLGDFSETLEALPLNTSLIVTMNGNAGEFVVSGQTYGDRNGNVYIGDSCIFRDEMRYSKFGGVDSSVTRIQILP